MDVQSVAVCSIKVQWFSDRLVQGLWCSGRLVQGQWFSGRLVQGQWSSGRLVQGQLSQRWYSIVMCVTPVSLIFSSSNKVGCLLLNVLQTGVQHAGNTAFSRYNIIKL